MPATRLLSAAASSCLLLFLNGAGGARVHAAEQAQERDEHIDTHFLFGFTVGADVGEPGELELEQESIAALGKRNGSYAAVSAQLRLEFVPIENLRCEVGVPVAFFHIAGVDGLDDRQRIAYDGIVSEFRYRLLARDRNPFALTIGIDPHWGRTDEVSGAGVDAYGGEMTLAADRELIANRLFGAINLLYDPELTRSRAGGQLRKESTVGVLVSMTTQVRPDVFVGAEARYLRAYDDLGVGAFAGEAFFVGPNVFARLSSGWAISGGWGIQVAGHAAGIPGSYDLVNFTRRQATLRFEYNF